MVSTKDQKDIQLIFEEIWKQNNSQKNERGDKQEVNTYGTNTTPTISTHRKRLIQMLTA